MVGRGEAASGGVPRAVSTRKATLVVDLDGNPLATPFPTSGSGAGGRALSTVPPRGRGVSVVAAGPTGAAQRRAGALPRRQASS